MHSFKLAALIMFVTFETLAQQPCGIYAKREDFLADKFSYGVSDRGASIRIPIATVENGWKGWLEDRRPNSAADPYKVAARIIKTVKSVPAYATVNGY